MISAAFAALLAASLVIPPRPQPPGPEAWTFREELAECEQPAAGDGDGLVAAADPWLKELISRCFFGPIKRAPYFRDELLDDVDYYPDGYLEKLRRDGVNGLWITVEFAELAETRFFPRDPDAEKRLEKLRRTARKCARYGIRLWIFAIEPLWATTDHPWYRLHPEMFVRRERSCTMCPEIPEVAEYLESAMKDIFTRVPELAGFIGITVGESLRYCFDFNGEECPRCCGLPRWKMLNGALEPMIRGMKSAKPEARFISWFYMPEARTTVADWVLDCVKHHPDGAEIMYNFESGSLVKQCDRWRIGGDYWLSQPGPGVPYAKIAEVARANGKPLAAKIQMACSHEDATVPYIPVPGLLYRKFKAMREAGVSSAMLSWYFGNYPCVMSRAAGMLASDSFGEGEDAFLRRLAATDWGAQSNQVASLWKEFGEAYRHYPVSNYMQYYGPYHAGLVWALRPDVEMLPLEPTWMPHYDPAGDSIGECLRDFTLDEAASLAVAAAQMPEPTLATPTRKLALDVGVMKAVRRQFLSARNIFQFYAARREAIYLSRERGDNAAALRELERMRELVKCEQRLSTEMIPLCENDSRLGFHSEAEAHQFFPERLRWRIAALEAATGRIDEIAAVLKNGGSYPESDWEIAAPRLTLGGEDALGAQGFVWRARELNNGDLLICGEVPDSIPSVRLSLYDACASEFPLTYGFGRDEKLFSPFWNGEERDVRGAKVRIWPNAGSWAFALALPRSSWGGDDRLRPAWAFFCTSDRNYKPLWPAKATKAEPRLWHWYTPRQFGRMMRPSEGASPSMVGFSACRASLSIPRVIPAAENLTCRVFFRDVTLGDETGIDYSVECPVGTVSTNCWTFLPSKDDRGKSYPLAITALRQGQAFCTARSEIRVALAPEAPERPLAVALLGDSLTNSGYQDALMKRLHALGFSGYRPVGSRTGNSASPIGIYEAGKAAHDGYGGYSWRSFLENYAVSIDEIDNTQAEAERAQLEANGISISADIDWRKHLLKSPLVRLKDGRKALDVQAWFDRVNNGHAPEAILIALGSNDIFPAEPDGYDDRGRKVMPQVSKDIDQLLAALRKAAPDSVIAIISAPPGGYQCAFEANYGGYRSAEDFRSATLAYNRYVEDLVVRADDPHLRFIPAGQAIDPSSYPLNNALHMTSKGGEELAEAIAAGIIGGIYSADTRPYEFIDVNRFVDEIPPLVDFEDNHAWIGGSVTSERMLFGRRTLKMTFSGPGEARVRPPSPVSLPDGFGWFGGWIRNDARLTKFPPDIALAFATKDDGEVRLPLRNYYGKSKLDWPDWQYAVRRFSKDELDLLRKSATGFNGFVISGYTNAEPVSVYFDNLSFFNRDETKRLSVPSVPPVAIPVREEGACPVTSGPAKAQFFWKGDLDSLEVSWNGGPRFRPAAGGGVKTFPEKAVYRVEQRGNTLVVDVSAPAGERAVSLGHVLGAKVLSRLPIPCLGDGYWWDENRSKVSAVEVGQDHVLVLAFPDWYESGATEIVGEKQADGGFDRVIRYRARTDGSYNPVHERLYITVSTGLMDVLPVVANPVSPWKHVTGTKAWTRYSGSTNRTEDLEFLTRLHGYGIRDLVINEHECCFRDDGESFTFREKSAPKKGGDEALRRYADYVINVLGFRFGPYNNFTDLAPVNANWSFDHISRKSPEDGAPDSGGLRPAWTRCYAPKAAFAYDACRRYAPVLRRRFGFNTAYCDVHSAILPWEYVDCDARVPGGGSYQPYYRAYANIFLEQKKAWNGPVYSEGTSHFFYAGLVDGNYGQLGIRADFDPWIVDFDLNRLHPLECDFGVGNIDMFLPGVPKDPSASAYRAAVDRFIAATLAFGHAPYLVLGPMFTPRTDLGNGYPSTNRHATPEVGLPFVLRSYFMVLPASKLYTQATAEEIRYFFDDGRWLTASEAIFTGDRELQRIAVRYSDGTCVVANGHREKRLTGEIFGRAVDLPPTGYQVWNEARRLEIESSDRYGARVDYSASEDAVYLDTRDCGHDVEFPRAKGRGIAVHLRNGSGWQSIPVRGKIVFR